MWVSREWVQATESRIAALERRITAAQTPKMYVGDDCRRVDLEDAIRMLAAKIGARFVAVEPSIRLEDAEPEAGRGGRR